MMSFEHSSIGSRLQCARLPRAKRLDEPIRGHLTKLTKLHLAQNSCGMQEPERWLGHVGTAVILQVNCRQVRHFGRPNDLAAAPRGGYTFVTREGESRDGVSPQFVVGRPNRRPDYHAGG